MDEEGVSSVLGTLLMMGLMMTLLPGAIMMKSAWDDEMAAQREASERAAYCARHADVGPPTCDAREPMVGYDCRAVEAGAWLCTARNGTTPTPPTPTPIVVQGPTPVTLPTVGL